MCLECAVQRKRSVRSASILVVADVSAVKIKLSVRLVTGLGGERYDRRNLPVKTSTGSNIAICYHRMVELRHSVRVPECVVSSEGCFRNGGACVKRQIAAEFVLHPRCGHDSIQQPLWSQLPAKSCGRNHRVLPFDVDAHPEDKLHVRTENVRTADNKRHIEIIPKQMTKARIVEARLRFRPNENGIGQLRIESDDCAEGLQRIRQGGVIGKAK